MKYSTKFIGFDVSKDKIAIAVADEGREASRYWGTIAHTPEAVRKFIKQMGDIKQIEVCYEAGPTGYELHRWLTAMKVTCRVVAPSLIPKRAGDQVKTDRRDAERLAQLLRAGELTAVYVPDQDDEALRDLVRAREDAKKDIQTARQRLLSFLLRQQKFPPVGIKRRWTQVYREWLNSLKWENDMQRMVFEEYMQAIRESEGRKKRLEAIMTKEVVQTKHAKLIEALQALRGIQLLTAVTIAAEICTFLRFKSPKHLMSYLGLVPRERSSGATTRRGGITK
ncbi:IS110 family transposase, partial [Paenibacillus eucommiae]